MKFDHGNTIKSALSHFLKTHLSMIDVRPQKMYRRQPAKTRLITSTIRVGADWRPPATITKPENSRLHQSGSAGVFRFKPDPNFACCKARCMSHFVTPDDECGEGSSTVVPALVSGRNESSTEAKLE